MSPPPDQLALEFGDALALMVQRALAARARAQGRVVIAIAGGPAAGKSTLAGRLVEELNDTLPGCAGLVALDGFHVRHADLVARGLADRKGAPETFAAEDFVGYVENLRDIRWSLPAYSYDRSIEDVVETPGGLAGEASILVVEGNYLLLPDPPWDRLRPVFDFCVFLTVAPEDAERRLLARHAEHGRFTDARNRRHVAEIDLPNLALVAGTLDRADLVLSIPSYA